MIQFRLGLIEEIVKIRSRIQDVGPVTETLESFKIQMTKMQDQGQLLEKDRIVESWIGYILWCAQNIIMNG